VNEVGLASRALDLFDDLLSRRIVDLGDEDAGTFERKKKRRFAADAAPRARDDGDLVLEPELPHAHLSLSRKTVPVPSS
jgi:hypothetical protein